MIKELAASKHRNLKELKRTLKLVEDEIDLLDKEFDGYQKLFASTQLADVEAGVEEAARGIKVINFDDDANDQGNIEKGPSKPQKTQLKSKDLVGKSLMIDLPKLKDNFGLLVSYNERLSQLKEMELTVKYEYKTAEGKGLLKEIQAMQDKTLLQIKKAYAFVSKVAKEKAPKDFMEVTEGVFDLFKKDYKGQYGKSTSRLIVDVYTNKDSNTVLRFTHYLLLNDLMDSSDTLRPEYIIAISSDTGKLSAKTPVVVLDYRVATLGLGFKMPGKFNQGVKFNTVKKGYKVLQLMLEADSVLDAVFDSPLPGDPNNFDSSQWRSPSLKDVSIERDKVVLKLRVTDKMTTRDALSEVLMDFKNILGRKVLKTGTVQHKMGPVKRGIVTIELWFRPNPDEDEAPRFNRDQLQELKTWLNLTDSEVNEVRRVLAR